MTPRPATIAAAVVAASALAGASYALGSQNDGAAVASRMSGAQPGGAPAWRAFRHARRDAGLDRLAQKLGVSTGALTTALRELRPMRPRGEGRGAARLDRAAAGLATALGVDAATVKAALEKIAPQPGHRRGARHRRVDFATALAKQLGLETSKVTAAFDKLREQRRGAFARALASRLGIPVDTVTRALGDGRPLFGRGHGHP
jgi:hypothetical protein